MVQNPGENVVNLDVAAETIRCKDDLYDSLVRNRYFLPSKKDPLCTVYFLQGVFSGEYWCFNSADVKRLIPVADPPSREYLSTTLADRMVDLAEGRPREQQAAWVATAEHIRGKQPDAEYCILLLSTYYPQCEIFNKDYVRPRPQAYAVLDQYVATVANRDGFLDNLPKSAGLKRNRGSATYMLTKRQKEEKKLLSMRLKME